MIRTLLLLLFLPLFVDCRRRTILRIPWSDEIFLKVDRDSPIGTRVARIGRPPELWNRISYHLSSDQSIPFSVQPPNGVIIVTRPLNRDTNVLRYNGLIIAKSSFSTSSASTSSAVTAKVTFIISIASKTPYRLALVERRLTVRVKENNEIGQPLGRLRVSQPPPPGTRVEYSVQGPGRRLVTVNRRTGQIRARISFDREALNSFEKGYNVTLIARLRGKLSAQRGQMARIQILVEDQNDNAPVFLGSRGQTFFVPENTTRGAYIGRLKASDRDMGVNGFVSFSPLGRSAPFQVAPDGGILLLGRLDRERQAEHLLAAVATDGGHPPQSTTTTATVRVEDVNDSPPYFVNIPKLLVTSCEIAAPNSMIGQIQAQDPDEPPNNVIRYALWTQDAGQPRAGESRHHFVVDQTTGVVQIQVMRPDLACSHHSVNLSVAAYDPGRSDFKVQRTIRLVMTQTEEQATILRSAISAELSGKGSRKGKAKKEGEWMSPAVILIAGCVLVPIVTSMVKLVSCFFLV